MGGERTNIPSLRHPRDTTGQVAGQECQDGREAPGQLAGDVPDVEVVALAAAEALVLDQQDDGEGDGPVAEERDEVADDGRQVLATGDGEDGDDDRVGQRPDETRDGVEVVAKQLQGQARGVVDGHVVADDGEDEQHEAELGEVQRAEGLPEEAAQAVVRVRG